MSEDRQPDVPAWRMPREPVFYAAVAYGAGILIGAHCWRPMLWWIVAAGVGAVGTMVLARATRNPHVSCANVGHQRYSTAAGRAVLLLSFVALGALGIRARNSADVRPEMSAVTDGREVVVTGYVVKDGAIRGAGAQRRETVDVQIESVEVESAEETPPSTAPTVGHPTQSSSDRTDQRRRRAACKANSVWDPELLKASGIALCGDEASNKVKVKRPSLDFVKDGAPSSPVKPQNIVVTPNAAVRLSIYSRERWDESDDADESELPKVFTYGQRIRFPAKLRPPRNFGNPGALDYAGYLAEQEIYALGSARTDRIEVLNGIGGSRWGRWRSRMRRSIVAQIHALWPPKQAALLDAMLIGEAAFIGRETKTDFQRTGIYHILVVSGMNVAILAAVVFWTLKRLRIGQIAAVVLTFLLTCGYAYVAESGAPIMRPVITLSIFMCARLLYREGAMLNSLGIAALALLVLDPRALTDASFQLTFVSVLGIVGIAVPIMERTSGPYMQALGSLSLIAKDPSLEPRQAQFRIDLRMIAERLARFLPSWPNEFRGVSIEELRKRAVQRALTTVISAAISGYELLIVSLVAQVTLTLPMAWYFHRVTVMSLPANLIAVPLVGVLMPSSVAAVALGYVWKPVAHAPAVVASCSVLGITKAVQVFGGLRTANIRVANPAMIPVIFAAAAFAVALVLVRRKWVIASVAVCGLVMAALCVALPGCTGHRPVPTHSLEITSIDVGQAESTLVITPEGKTVLVDAGGSLGPWQSEFDFGEDVVSPYLWAHGITRLDAVCLTHAHSDHFGGMHAVIQNFRPRELWMGPTPDIPEIRALLNQAQEARMVVVRRSAGDQFEFGGASVQVMSPPRDWIPSPKLRNNDSLVLRFQYGKTSALLEADAEKQMEEIMTPLVSHADVIKIAHNGSKTSSTPEFLQAVHPQYAVISVGSRNSFGHPRPEVLERLDALHVSTYRTDELGAVTFLLDGERVTPVIRPQYR